MKEKIKAEFKKYGLDENDEKLVDKIKVEKEEQIEEAVRDFAIDYLAEQKYDQRMTKALATQKEKLEAEWKTEKEELGKKLSETKSEDDNKEGNGADNTNPDIGKVIGEYLKPITEKLENITKEQEQTKINQAIGAELKRVGLPVDKFAKFVKVEKADDIPDAVDGLKKEIDEVTQSIVDKKLKDVGTPFESKGEAGSQLIETIVQEMNEGSPQEFEGILDKKKE